MKKAICTAAVLLLLVLGAFAVYTATSSVPTPRRILFLTEGEQMVDQPAQQAAWHAILSFAEERDKQAEQAIVSARGLAYQQAAIEAQLSGGVWLVVLYGSAFEEAVFTLQQTHANVMFLLLNGEANQDGIFETAFNTHSVLLAGDTSASQRAILDALAVLYDSSGRWGPARAGRTLILE